MREVIVAGDLVGCQYRQVQRRAHPEIPRTHASQARARRHAAAVDHVLDLLPRKAPGRFRRVDLEGDAWERSMATLEALAYGYTHITGAVFSTDTWQVEVDLLLREGDKYTPIIVSNHRVARPHSTKKTLAVPTHRLGLSEPLEVGYKLRHHAVDGYRLAFAARALEDMGLNSGRGAAIGQDRSRAFFTDTARFDVESALQQPVPSGPRRVKECATCRFWEVCGPELEAVDEISLFLPGDGARPFRERGIHTVQGLIDANLGEPSELAAAWREDIPLLARGPIKVTRADVEVDVDMEAYLDQGAYLWGAWYEGEYHPFVTWEPLGGRAEAENFEAFWSWLMDIRAKAHAEGKTFAAYCYSAHGENHWMRRSAERFHGVSLKEVEEFISSDEWVDLFVEVKRNFAGSGGLGLKVVAPVAGFHWPDEDFDGEEAVNARRDALAGDEDVREQLLEYNRGDVQATAVVREWMDQGAPGVKPLKTARK
ncbi:TM0106 family RecB-like putative nuclease [Corynebacterium camporealensis]